jgi:tRNA dimethylallyltransferase
VTKLVAIVGPTGSGKSALAMEVARRHNGEIICADSRTVYKGMDIGTAKPTHEEQAEIPHHLLDVVEPGETFTAVDFKVRAFKAINEINSRGNLPIVVGGTGLYIDALLFDYKFGSTADPDIRRELLEKSVEELQNLCRENDIEIPSNQQNKRHLVRAIELGGLLNHKKKLRKDTIIVGITIERSDLRERITSRAQSMVTAGIVKEVKSLSQQYGWENEAMTGNIYKVFREVVKGTKDIHQALEEVIRSDMRLAKRQGTWFKRNPHIYWDAQPGVLLTKIEQFLES